MSKAFDRRWIALLIAAVVWFILFPADLEFVLSPVKQISNALSLGAYILISVIVVCRTWKSAKTSSTK